jgi:NAD(P)-dependent dehydrogenase (short-subunit alcohol dehydrogenase family)
VSAGSGPLEGLSALVVRAGSPIGRAALERLLADGALVSHVEGDPADAAARGSALASAVEANGRIDVLVIPPPAGQAPLALGAADLAADIGAALRTPYFLMQEAARRMTGGRICLAAPQRPDGLETPEPASLVEGAFLALVRLLAVELAPRKIAVNALCPIAALAPPSSVASALSFLASPASAYMTGALLPLGGA